ncbi:hypothetical protein ETB97_003629 [Aspergillus alliaceus]|uniref:MARVEL domain-containing protein n=1 Tax=Petromyces alliaceus TaxID=209559 RepID=A0A5N6FR38_PETAA|nr:uncharacterized protein BDW43DRAFT_279444 [Aspergillus alliaceus]KAB8232452.1 hypothetical protein BDW43DRAFT_279444 [Aspergillus alliaceus]KAE8393383.1 hypothetical protein BDV23DRAFT_149570 [Aspergillus alliaceus]KAF5858880.1 hypothetical protein ETB97_003629 [Aspergillus burnettii]
MGFGGVILRFFNLAIRVLQFLDGAVILGIFSYFLAVLTRHDQAIPQWMKATEGLSGAATLYGLLGILFTCCLGGVAFFATLAVVLDVCFVGAMIAIAIMTRDGTQKCTGRVDTPLGSGDSNAESPSKVKYGFACELQKVTFAVAIIGIFFFLISILFQVLYARHHKREKRFGPSPANGYTYGTRPRAFWRRKKNNLDSASGDDMLPTHPTPNDVELGPTSEKSGGIGSLFSRNKDTAPGVPQNGYGYGNSAYTGNY